MVENLKRQDLKKKRPAGRSLNGNRPRGTTHRRRKLAREGGSAGMDKETGHRREGNPEIGRKLKE